MSSTSSTHTVSRLLLITLLLVAVCTANLATGRASLRPSAGKRSAAVLVGRSPAHYYQLAAAAAAKRLENELTCNMHTMTVLEARYQQLQEEIEEIIEVMEACQTIRAVNAL